MNLTELRAAKIILKRGVEVTISAPLFLRWFGKKKQKLLLKVPSMECQIAISEAYLETGINVKDEESVSDSMAMIAKHGRAVSEIVAMAIRNGISEVGKAIKSNRNGQKFLRMPVPYLEKNTDKFGIIEHTHSFPEIFPKRIGTVTAINPSNPMEFTDSSLDFDLNAYNEYGTTALIAGTSAKVIFQTGDLAGYTLDIQEHGFNSTTKTFTLLKNKDEKSFEIPSANFRPKVGDKYILVDIMMPKKYVDNAEAELQAKAQEYLDKNSTQRFIYSMETDPIYFQNLNVNLKLGNTIKITETDFNLDNDIRIISITKDLQNPYKIDFEIAETATISQIVRNYIEQEKKETEILRQQKINAEMARRSYLFAEELKNNVFDGSGYFDAQKIKPLSIETKHILIGDRTQQFTLPDVSFFIENNNSLRYTAGKIVHLTIEENGVREWNIATNVVPLSPEFLHLYVKADKVGNNATIIATREQIKVTADAHFYHFEVGSISSIQNGIRRIKTNYGFAQINPAELSIGRISDPSGNNFIELLQDRININAKVTFSADSPALQQVNDSINVGGRNLLLDSINQGIQLYGVTGTVQVVDNDLVVSKKSFRINVSGRTIEDYVFYLPTMLRNKTMFNHALYDGESIILSFYIKTNSPQVLRLDGGAKTYPINSSWAKVEYTVNPNGNIHFKLSGNNLQTVDIHSVKLEKGNKATDWTPAPEDVEAQITTAQNVANQALGLTQSQTANITALQQKTDFLSSTQINGNAIATGTLVVDNGLGANAGITGLGGSSDAFIWGGADYNNKHKAPISLHRDGFLRVRNAQGRVIFEIGQKNGEAVFDVYNNNGARVAEIGQRGIEFVGYTPENYHTYDLLKLNDVNFNHNPDIIHAIDVFAIEIRREITDTVSHIYEITFNTNITAFGYSAGRNFETPSNVQYEGFIYAAQNKFGAKISDGVYAVKSEAIADSFSNWRFDLDITVYNIV